MNPLENRRELWLLSRLNDHGIKIDSGDTTFEVRRDRVRRSILAEGLAPIVVCRGKSGRPMTYREVFPHIYREPLEVTDAP